MYTFTFGFGVDDVNPVLSVLNQLLTVENIKNSEGEMESRSSPDWSLSVYTRGLVITPLEVKNDQVKVEGVHLWEVSLGWISEGK